ncbi:NACHT domain-containing protein [Streptomyces sp. MMS21 TC-5]|uniref:NACHT domain-containing protein n=1 Tax=Streptomyces sp. MMS21 TC-5 TaxID=2925833 RepID=UPI001F601AAC|nr:NACHT domain-containing protein [Streptomyces sp. MMS21 TC-5]MCI4078777.1 NACHT domain-containing protein [Streptomyces sp. MMS21 TC-5]
MGGLLIAASVLYAGVHVVRGSLEASDTVGLLGLPLGVAALVVSLAGLRQRPAGDLAHLARGWAATLAEQVKQDQQRQWRQLIGDDTQRINLSFTLCSDSGRAAAAPAPTGHMFGDTSTVLDVATYYRRTFPRRLVVTGEPGSGKTVLVLELMLVLLEERAEEDPVPVRLSLAEWDPTVPLPKWLARHLVDVYDWPAEMAEELVRQQRVLPVLDGLDEMDATDDGVPASTAPRARAALEVLNTYQRGREAGPVIVTCRTRHYEALESAVRLIDAARIDIDPVTTPAACAYLRQRARDPARWRAVLEALEGEPTGVLASALSTPWRLSLAATIYARDGDPAEMLHHAAIGDLDDFLLARLVPAAAALHPRPHRPYSASDVQSWLSRLAGHLEVPWVGAGAPGAAGTGARTDLVLHQLWPMAGSGRVRVVDAVLTALIVLTPLALAWGSPHPGLKTMVVLAAVVAGCQAARTSVDPPTRVRWGRLRTPAGWRDLGFGLLLGLAFWPVFWPWYDTVGALGFGLALGLGAGLTRAIGRELSTSARPGDIVRRDLLRGARVGLVFVAGFTIAAAPGEGLLSGLVIGLLFGLVIGLAVGFTRTIECEPSTTARPRDVIRNDLLRGLAAGVTAGIAVGLGWGLLYGLTQGVAVGLAAAPGYGLAVGLMVGVGFGAPSGRRYLVFVLCCRGKLPWRLGAFMDWACTAGLLRLAGTAYQFRHRELQRWLTCHQRPHDT